MYLPTFWKLTTEATMYRARHMAGYGLPVTFLCKSIPISDCFVCIVTWIMFPSLYNWVFSCIIPPPRGVPKRD